MKQFYQFIIKRLFVCILITSFQTLSVFGTSSHRLLITEIMAINGSTLTDENGDYSDWIEIYNPGITAINLYNWSLTDDQGDLYKWQFPNISLSSGAYLVVFASNKNRSTTNSELHTNFKLSGSGEFLALVEPDMKTISYSYDQAFPAQQEDIAFGLLNNINVFLSTPTPGKANISGNQVIDPVFNRERGFYNEPFSVELTTPQTDVSIYYTTDGTAPDHTTGKLYSSAISISTTTPLSAVAINNLGEKSSVVTHTYLFISNIVQQSNNPAGYPDVWSTSKYSKNRLPADYEMDPEVCTNPAYVNLFDEAFKAIPSLCIVTNKDFIFSLEMDENTGGIYIYTGNTGDGSKGLGWERPTSVEFIDPQSGQNFQVNCGLLLHGGNSRVPDNSQKHSFRISFRSEYGASKLKFNFFDDKRNPVNEFNSLVLRAGYNYAWTKNDAEQNKRADFLRDPFAKNTQLDMGHPSAHNRFVHLYLNGLYWGVYNVSEKITDDFMESYMNGAPEDWDVVKDHNGTVDGTRTAWTTMFNLAKSGLSSTAAYQKIQGNSSDGIPNSTYSNYLDVENLVDYILFNFYMGNKDWDGNNWLAARNKVETKYGFRFFAWDGETTMIDVDENIVTLNDGEPTQLFNFFMDNNDFKLLVADRIHKHFFNSGALSPEETSHRYQDLANEIDMAIIGESARWGDYRRDLQPVKGAELYTRNDHWLVEVNNQLANYLPNRSQIVFNQLKSAGYFPNIKAPLFSNNGQKITDAIDLTINNPNTSGQIYYTTNDVDPREQGGNISASAQIYQNALHIIGQGNIKARVKSGSEWSALSEANFKSDNTSGFVTSTSYIGQLLSNCYPNPVNDIATFTFQLPETGNVAITIYATDGRLIEKINCGILNAGDNQFMWNATTFDNGLYFYQIIQNGKTANGKMLIQK